MHRFSRVSRLFAAVLLVIALFAQTVPALAVSGSTSMASKGSRYVVTVNGLHCRKGPGTSYAIADKFSKGTVLTYYGRSGGWWKVAADDGTKGYVDRQYLTPVATEKQGNYFVTASSLRIRKAPKTSAGVVGTVKKGTIVTISKLNGDWGYLSAGATQGWIALKYLSHYNSNVQSESAVSVYSASNRTLYKVTADSLNVRASGSTRAHKIDSIRRGTSVFILKVDGEWGRIAYKKSGKIQYGWVNLDYLRAK